jgi:hypothetical protein
MLTVEVNDLLCRVEGDAPMGQIMRRHGMPACLSEDIDDASDMVAEGPEVSPTGRAGEQP